MNKLRKIKNTLCVLLVLSVILTASSCEFMYRRSIPLESPVPQTKETIELVKPEGQDDTVKPFFITADDDLEDPVRPLESYETIRDVIVGTDRANKIDELIALAQKGRKPLFPENSPLRPLYNKVLMVLNTIIQNYMTDYQRVRAIYEYISYYTVYDYELYEEYEKNDGAVSKTHPSFSIEGVFNKGVAVCEGMAEAFSLMCSIEGIENVIVIGSVTVGDKDIPHAWNKVKLDGVWYAVDSTNASFKPSSNAKEYLNHAYFLISDSELGFKEEGLLPVNYKYDLDKVKADINYGFYEKEYIEGYKVLNNELPPKLTEKNYVFNSALSLSVYITYLQSNGIKAAEFYSNLSSNLLISTLGMQPYVFYKNVYYILL